MELGLINYLRTTTAIAALVSDRIEFGLRPQGSALPSLALMLVSRIPIDSDEGDSGLTTSRVQMDCWDATMTGAKALATEVKRALSGRATLLPGGGFEGVWTENESDYPSELDKGGVPIFRASLDFLINHQEQI